MRKLEICRTCSKFKEKNDEYACSVFDQNMFWKRDDLLSYYQKVLFESMDRPMFCRGFFEYMIIEQDLK